MSREEREKQQNQSGDPQGSQESDDKSETEGGRKPEDKKADGKQANDQNLPPWMARLPAEIRDYFSGGRYEKVPARYRVLIDRYTRWLNKKHAQDK